MTKWLDDIPGERPTETNPIVCEGGPWDGQWFDADTWYKRRRAAIRMEYGPERPAGRVLGYQRTDHLRSNMDPKVRCEEGRVWQWKGPRS